MPLHPNPHINKKDFWTPILTGTFIGIGLFIVILYSGLDNIFTCLFFIPFTVGFISLARAKAIIQADTICRLCLPWAALVITLPLAYWKLKIFILATFPIASIGGWIAGKLMSKWRHMTD